MNIVNKQTRTKDLLNNIFSYILNFWKIIKTMQLSIITKQQDDKTTLQAFSPYYRRSYEYNIMDLTTNGIVITNYVQSVEQSKVKLKSSQMEQDDGESSESGYAGNSSIKK